MTESSEQPAKRSSETTSPSDPCAPFPCECDLRAGWSSGRHVCSYQDGPAGAWQLLVALQTGLRNSELTSLRRQEVELGAGAHVRCLGKGRKARRTPLRPDVAKVLDAWLREQEGEPTDPVFPSSRGGPISADAFQRLVAKHTATASKGCSSLNGKRVKPHTLRHTAAMDLLRRGVDLSVIGLWLGHESTQSTEAYLHADMRLKEQALGHATSSGTIPERYAPADPLLAFLEAL